MEYRQLGKDGPQVPVLGLGTWPIGGGMGLVDENTAIATIHAAIDSGITLLDTAQGYRTSEATIGKALKGGYRERCFLATKVSDDYSPQAIRAAMENSLRALDVDYVDLYQIHHWAPEHPIEESMEVMARLQQEGKTRAIGVSNFDAGQMAQALQVAPFQANQVRYNLFDRQIEAQDVPFCEGLLTGKYSAGHQFAADDERSGFGRFKGKTFVKYLAAARRLEEIARDKGLTLIQLALAWALRLPAITCVLVGAKSPAQVSGYLGAVGVTFSDGELTRIEEALAGEPGTSA
jgi:aryl-alcohol dehydrogenase-like predicted oxidoreductase